MKKLLVALCMILVFTLSGCSFMSLEGSQIMCPPKATGNKAEIQKLIDDQTSGEYTLKYPKSGTMRSSIVMHNLDSDENEEAIAFYSDKSGDHIHVLFAECEDSQYSVIDDVLLEASDIDRIDFADLNGDKTCEILIGYSVSTSPQNMLSIFRYNRELATNDTVYPYSSLIIGDFTSDKRDDVLLLSLYSSDTAAKAQLMVYNKGALTELSSAELDSDIKHFTSVQYGQISYGTYGAVIDAVNSASDYTTQIILFDTSSSTLLNPLYTISGYSLTQRSTQICSLDFDEDELIDIPLISPMMHNEADDISTVARRINWSNLDTQTYTLNTSNSTILCGADGYLFTMPQKWNESVTARYQSEKRELTIYACEYMDGQIVLTDTLLTIKSFSDEEFDKESSGYVEFMRKGATVYTYSIETTDSYLSISGDEVNSYFKPINI